jgi:hypothetical protein
MRHLIILGFNDSASAQAVRTALQQADPAQLTILAEESLAPLAQPAAAKTPLSLSLLVRVPLAMFVGLFAGIYYGAKSFSQTLEAVSNFLSKPQANTNGQVSLGRMVLLVDEAQAERFADQFKQLGANVQQMDLSAVEKG